MQYVNTFTSDKKPTSRSIYAMFGKIMSEISSYYAKHLQLYGEQLERFRLGVDEERFELLSDDVKECYFLTVSADNPDSHGDNFSQELFDLEFNIAISVFVFETKCLVMIEIVQLPKYLRGRGIFTSIVRHIKEFMDLHNLGIVVGMSDASDSGESSHVLAKFELVGDPFMTEHYKLLKPSLEELATPHTIVQKCSDPECTGDCVVCVLGYCSSCGEAEGGLRTHCPGKSEVPGEDYDFRFGQWWKNLSVSKWGMTTEELHEERKFLEWLLSKSSEDFPLYQEFKERYEASREHFVSRNRG